MVPIGKVVGVKDQNVYHGAGLVLFQHLLALNDERRKYRGKNSCLLHISIGVASDENVLTKRSKEFKLSFQSLTNSVSTFFASLL